MQQVDPRRIAIFGASGTGKSTRVRQLIAERERVIVYDVLHEYKGHIVTSLVDVMEAVKAAWGKPFKIVYRPAIGTDREKELHNLSMALFRVQEPYKAGQWKHPVTLVVEEMSTCYNVSQRPPERDGFGELCSMGRHYGIGVIGVSQRPAQVGTNFRGNVSETYGFRLAENTDIQYFRQKFGSAVAASMPDLAVGECQFLKDGQVERMQFRP